ncbi:MAG: choice-of-anchor L domain-containing protein [Byssovorax sp.]
MHRDWRRDWLNLGHSAALIAACSIIAAVAASCGGTVSSSGTTGSTTSSGTSSGTGGSSATTGTGGSTGGTGGANTGGTGGTGNVEPKCTGNADCANDPKGKVCDAATGQCVQCTLADDQCVAGQYCDGTTDTCKVGCTDAADCAAMGGANLICNTDNHTCVGCLVDTDCPLGSVCFAANGVCVPGCSATQGCQDGFTCCGSACFDVTSATTHCGSCDKNCAAGVNPPATCGNNVCDMGEDCANCPGDCPCNAPPVCNAGMCQLGACDAAYADCNGDANDGCEHNVLQDGPCLCAPGSTQACYNGGPGTLGKGPCVAGTQTCAASGTEWGPCVGQVLPKSEVCANGIDEDCNGQVDDVPDLDGDGWTACNGDCCDAPGACGGSPKQINPGAFEVVGNGVDDDCDPATSDVNAPAACSNASKFGGVTADDMAKAMDICQVTTANAPLPTKKWGLLSALFRLPDGSAPTAAALTNNQDKQTAILQNYGTGGVAPHKGPTMAGMSSGWMRDENDPGYAGIASVITGANNGAPPSYLAAHGGSLPSSAGCSGNCPAGNGAFDPVNLRLSIRVPTNAKSFSYDFRFFSAEYWTWQCTSYNDFYLALLQTGAPGIPNDKNITFDANNNPVSVNNGFFQVCAQKGCNICPSGTGELAGTGMEVGNTGGGTTWLTTDSPIVAGETITLDLMVFDVSDATLDSLVILDNFRWSLQAAVVGTHM